MTLKTFNIDYSLRDAIKNSLYLSQTIRFFIEASIPIAFIYVTFEFINSGKTGDLLISLILILKSVPFIQQSITCISTAQLNQKSYYAVKELLEKSLSKNSSFKRIKLEKVSEIIINKIVINKFNLNYPLNIIKKIH